MQQENNVGYRLGMRVRHLWTWNRRLAEKVQRRGIPRWVAYVPAFIVLVALAGLLLAGAMLMVGLIILMLFIAIYLFSAANVRYSEPDESLDDGYNIGPGGPGFYVDGKKVNRPD